MDRFLGLWLFYRVSGVERGPVGRLPCWMMLGVEMLVKDEMVYDVCFGRN